MIFQYPKTKHKRSLEPKQYKRYQSYKRFLRHEFARVCVYCRQPDTSAPNLIYSVDHYRPKSVRRFAHLVNAYSNLYYCCSNCNSIKTNYWPADESAGPFVVNPCDYEMAKHLRFNSQTGEVEPQSVHGRHTEQLLQLNAPELIEYRRSTLRLVQRFERDIADREKLIGEISKMLRAGRLSSEAASADIAELRAELEQLTSDMHRFTGGAPLPLIKVPFAPVR